MNALRHTLVSDGPTDTNLIPIIYWTLKHTAGIELSEGVLAELWRLPEKPQGISERLVKAVELYPCEVLFVHRDAEKEQPRARFDEIRQAFAKAVIPLPVIAVVPVRMLEAWLCFNEEAIRQASGNPNGKVALNLPTMKRVELRPDPKADLREALLVASEHSGRRRKKFNTAAAFWRVVDCIEDFSPLRELPSFMAFEKPIKALHDNDWKAGFYS